MRELINAELNNANLGLFRNIKFRKTWNFRPFALINSAFFFKKNIGDFIVFIHDCWEYDDEEIHNIFKVINDEDENDED